MPKNDDLDEDEPIRRPRPRRDDEEDDNRPRRRRDADLDAAGLIIPINVSGYSLAACYLGLISCLPFAGPVLGVIAIVCGTKALKQRKKNRSESYGAVTGDMRAVIGLVLAALGLLFSVPTTILVIVAMINDT